MTDSVVVGNIGSPFGDDRIERAVLERYDLDVVLTSNEPLEEYFRTATDAKAVINPPRPTDRAFFERMTELVAVATPSIGVDHIDLEAATDHGVMVINTPGYCRVEVASHALALILACERSIVNYYNAVQEGTWDWTEERPIRRFEGLTMGFLAFGSIPQKLAELVSGFGFDLLASDPYIDDEEIRASGVEPVDRETLYRRADILSVHTPLTDETRDLVDSRAFELLPNDATFVNTSRGGVVDQSALYDALVEGQIGRAGLDVLTQEPPDDTPLLELDNVVVTPHAGAYSEAAHEEARRRAAEDVGRALKGERPEGLVNEIDE